MNLTDLLAEAARAHPDRPALLGPGHPDGVCISFGQLEKDVRQITSFLRKEGFSTGDRILVLVPVGPDLYRVLLGLFRLGLTATFVDPSAGREAITRAVERARPVGFIGPRKAQLLRLLIPGLRRLKAYCTNGWFPLTCSWEAWRETPGEVDRPSLAPDTPALLTFTSGSTGTPKAAVRTHDFLLRQNASLTRHLPLPEGGVDLATLPIFVLSNLARGVTTLLPDADLRRPGFIEPGPVLAQIRRHRPSTTIASPAFLQRLLESDPEGAELRQFQTIYTGGAPLWPEFIERAARLPGPAEWVAVFGSTEVEPIAHLSLRRMLELLNDPAAPLGLPAGRPVEGLTVRILADQWGTPRKDVEDLNQLPLRGPGEPGEIIVSGDHVLGSYLDGAGDKEALFRVGPTRWRRLGDAGFLDAEGVLWLLGRCAAGLTRKDEAKLYPIPVEMVARQFDWVRQVAMTTIGQPPILALETTHDPSPDEEEMLRTRLWHCFGQEFRLLRLDTIPMDQRHNAKIDYPALEKKLARKI